METKLISLAELRRRIAEYRGGRPPCPATVRKAMREGGMPYVIDPLSRRPMFAWAEVEAWIRGRLGRYTPAPSPRSDAAVAVGREA